MNLSFSSVVKFLILQLFPVISLVFVVAFGLALLYSGDNYVAAGLLLFLISTSGYYVTYLVSRDDWMFKVDREATQNAIANLRREIGDAVSKVEAISGISANTIENLARKNDANEKLLRETTSEILQLRQRINMIENPNEGF